MKLFQGEGVAQDDEQAAKLFRKAAELGHPGGQYFLGRCFEKGRGVGKDMTEALRWYRRAGENGVSEACLALGNLYSEGFSVPQDQTEAFIWYSLAATKGDPIAEAFRNGARRKLSAEQLAQATKRLATMQSRKSGKK
jgi:TPR repeat protein